MRVFKPIAIILLLLLTSCGSGHSREDGSDSESEERVGTLTDLDISVKEVEQVGTSDKFRIIKSDPEFLDFREFGVRKFIYVYFKNNQKYSIDPLTLNGVLAFKESASNSEIIKGGFSGRVEPKFREADDCDNYDTRRDSPKLQPGQSCKYLLSIGVSPHYADKEDFKIRLFYEYTAYSGIHFKDYASTVNLDAKIGKFFKIRGGGKCLEKFGLQLRVTFSPDWKYLYNWSCGTYLGQDEIYKGSYEKHRILWESSIPTIESDYIEYGDSPALPNDATVFFNDVQLEANSDELTVWAIGAWGNNWICKYVASNQYECAGKNNCKLCGREEPNSIFKIESLYRIIDDPDLRETRKHFIRGYDGKLYFQATNLAVSVFLQYVIVSKNEIHKLDMPEEFKRDWYSRIGIGAVAEDGTIISSRGCLTPKSKDEPYSYNFKKYKDDDVYYKEGGGYSYNNHFYLYKGHELDVKACMPNKYATVFLSGYYDLVPGKGVIRQGDNSSLLFYPYPPKDPRITRKRIREGI